MRSFFKVGITSALFTLFGLTAATFSHALFIDFDNDQDGGALSAGTYITDQYDDLFTISAVRNNPPGAPVGLPGAMIFDTDNFTGGDDDLDLNIGNALIITEDGDASDPDDAAQGGTFTFDFTKAITEFGLTVLDIEVPASNTITLFDGAATSGPISFGSFGLGGWGNESIVTIAPFLTSSYGLNQVDKIEIAFDTSGAIGDVTASPVPEPATMMLFGTGLAGLAGLGYRRRKK